jgi:hypothetical protein
MEFALKNRGKPTYSFDIIIYRADSVDLQLLCLLYALQATAVAASPPPSTSQLKHHWLLARLLCFGTLHEH